MSLESHRRKFHDGVERNSILITQSSCEIGEGVPI